MKCICSSTHSPPKEIHNILVCNTWQLFLWQVLVISIMFRAEKVALQCNLRCNEQLYISKASTYIHWDHFGFPYGTADISCPLPSGCETPTHVTITSAAITNKGSEALRY